MKEPIIRDDDFGAEDRLMGGNERANRGERGQGAMLGVSAAPLGWIEVGDAGRWPRVPAAVVEELVQRGQAGAAPGKDGQEVERMATVYPTGPHAVYSGARGGWQNGARSS
jgi:hypothetical protein